MYFSCCLNYMADFVVKLKLPSGFWSIFKLECNAKNRLQENVQMQVGKYLAKYLEFIASKTCFIDSKLFYAWSLNIIMRGWSCICWFLEQKGWDWHERTLEKPGLVFQKSLYNCFVLPLKYLPLAKVALNKILKLAGLCELKISSPGTSGGLKLFFFFHRWDFYFFFRCW